MIEKMKCRISLNMKIAFAAAIISGVIVHASLMVLQPVTADPVLFLDWWKNTEYQLYSQGRWMANFACLLRGYVQPIFLNCFIRILDCGICAALLTDLFGIKTHFPAALSGIAVAIHPYIANSLLFYVSVGAFNLSITVLSVWNIWRPGKRTTLRFFISAILLMVCAAEGQSSVCLATLTIIMKCIIELLQGNRRDMIRNLTLSVSYCAVGCGGYMIVWKVLSKIHHITLFYGGAKNYSLKNTILNLGTSIRNSYSVFADYFWGNSWIHNTYWKREIIYSILLLILLFFFFEKC